MPIDVRVFVLDLIGKAPRGFRYDLKASRCRVLMEDAVEEFFFSQSDRERFSELDLLEDIEKEAARLFRMH